MRRRCTFPLNKSTYRITRGLHQRRRHHWASDRPHRRTRHLVIYSDNNNNRAQAGLETLYLTIALALTVATVAVPALAAILVDSLLLIPCYLAGILALGLSTNWDYLGDRVGTCGPHISNGGACRRAWHVFGALQILGMGLQILGLCVLRLLTIRLLSLTKCRVLAVVDLARVIRIRRAARSTKKEVF